MRNWPNSEQNWVELRQHCLINGFKLRTLPSVLKDNYSRYQKGYDQNSVFFCANPTKNISDLHLPFEDENKARVITKNLSKLIEAAQLNLVTRGKAITLYDGKSNPASYSRSINVFSPPPPCIVDQVVIVNDGGFYHWGNTKERIQEHFGHNTAVIFIKPEDAIYKEAKAEGVQFEACDDMPGMGTRTVDYKYRVDEYAHFIHDNLFPYLKKNGIEIPDSPSQRTVIGSSAIGTASICMGLTHPDM